MNDEDCAVVIGSPRGEMNDGEVIGAKPVRAKPVLNVNDPKPKPDVVDGAKAPNPARDVKPEIPRRSTAMSFSSNPAPIRPIGLARPVA